MVFDFRYYPPHHTDSRATSIRTMADTVVSILSTPCHTLLPEIIKPLFTSHAFVPHPQSTPIPLYGAIIPPLTYYLALFTLSAHNGGPLNAAAKYALAAISAATFISLPFQYHVPGSAIFTYQLGLIGCFGSARVLDIFFLSGSRKPQRITIPQPGAHTGDLRKPELGHEDESVESRNGRVYPDTDNLEWTKDPQPETVASRMWYALDLMISMRGIGWDFASAGKWCSLQIPGRQHTLLNISCHCQTYAMISALGSLRVEGS